MASNSVSEFMRSALVSWVKVVEGEGCILDYKTLCSGGTLNNIWHQIDPKPPHPVTIARNNDDMICRIRNLHAILKNIKLFYEDVLGQIVVMRMPDIIKLGKNPEEDSSLDEMNALLLLILGSAVQCEQKEVFIENIKKLDLESQHTIVECIKQVNENPESTWSMDWNDLCRLSPGDQEHVFFTLIQNVKRLVDERDDIIQRMVSLVLEHEICNSLDNDSNPIDAGLLSPSSFSSPEGSRLVVELAEVKSKLRRLLQELEEKNESIAELKEELETHKNMANRLRNENLELVQGARTAKAYRDEMDILKERVHKVDKLESEIQRYKDKMKELEYYRSRMEEIREDNKILTDTKIMLEEQLDSCRKRLDQIPELESELLKYQSKTNELETIQANNKDRIELLLEENSQLHFEKKSCMEELRLSQTELSNLRCQNNLAGQGVNLQDQLNADAQTRALYLELENNKLRMEVENSKQNTPVDERSNKELELLKELEEHQQKISTLEIQVSNLKQEEVETAKKTQTLENKRKELEATIQSLEAQIKILKSNETKHQATEQAVCGLNTENHLLHRTVKTLQDKLNEAQQEMLSLENENLKLNTTLESFKLSIRKYHDLEKENTNLEADNHKLEQEKKYSEKEIKRLRNAVEIKDSTIEELSSRVSSLERENKQLTKEKENLSYLSVRCREQEKENRELVQQVTLTKKTLAALRQDLVSEKIRNQQVSSEIDRLTMLQQENIKEEKEVQVPEIIENVSLFEEELQCDSSNALELTREKEQSSLKSEDGDKEWNPKEVSSLKSTVASLERKVVLLDEENRNFRNQASTLKDQNANLTSEVELLQQKHSSLNKQNTELHSKLAKLEVETSLLKSQNSSLTSQNTNYQCQVAAYEDRVKLLQSSIMELQDIQKSLLNDHETLQKLHNQLTLEYENLAAKYTTLKAQHRQLKVDHGVLQDKFQAVSISQEEVARLREVLDENPKVDPKSLISLRIQHSQLKEHFKSLKEENEKLQIDNGSLIDSKKALKTENNELKLKYTRLQGELAESKGHLSSLDVELNRLSSNCEEFNRLNSSLIEERTFLMQRVSSLLAEYHSLLERFVEDTLHDDNNALIKKLKDLSWQRNKLEQKFLENVEHNSRYTRSGFDLRRSRQQSSSAQSMRRTKSQLLTNSKIGSGEFSKDLSSKELNRKNLDRKSYNGFGENDEIPVRDVGPFTPEDSNANINSNSLPTNELGSENGFPSSKIPHSTSVENYTTVNFITNISPEHLSKQQQGQGGGSQGNNSPYQHSPNRPASTILCGSSDGSSTPVFGSIMPRTGLRCSRNFGKNHQRNLPTNNLNSNVVGGDSDEVNSVGGQTPGSALRNEQRHSSPSNGNSPSTKDKNKSSVWYEYGCV